MEGVFPTPVAPRNTERHCQSLKSVATMLAAILWLFAGSTSARSSNSAASEDPVSHGAPVTVVFFNDFHPFSFVAEDGSLQGVAVDWWRLWSEKTGIPIKLLPAPWSRIPELLRTGQADAIGAVGRVKGLAEKGFEFSPPLSAFDIRLFYRADIPGGPDVADFRDLTVGVIDNASCADWLHEQGVVTLKTYPNFHSMMDAALRGDVPAVCANKWSGLYTLVRNNAQARFRVSDTVLEAPMHWAVPPGKHELFERIAAGFASLPAGELEAVAERWNIVRFDRSDLIRKYAFAIFLAAVAGLVFLAWAVSLFVRVRRKRRKLQESTTRLQALIDNIPGVVYRKVYTNDGSRVVWVSDAVREILGISPQEVYNLSQQVDRTRLWHPEDLVRMPKNSTQIPADGFIEGEYRYVLDEGLRYMLKGGVRLMLMRERVTERKGSVVTVEGILMDITDRKQVEAELRRREYETRTLVENAPDCIARYDRNCRRVYANLAWSHRYGFTRPLPMGGTPGNAEGLDEPLVPIARLKEAIATGAEAEYDVRDKGANGKLQDFNVRLVPEFDADGAVDSILFVARDVTTLKDSQRALSRLAEAAPGAVFAFRVRPDGAASFPYVSAPIQDINGLRPDEIRTDASLAMERIHPDDQPRFAAAMEESARNLSLFHIDMRVRHPERGEVWIEVRSMPEREADGSTIWHGIMLDITARKRAELELHRREEEARVLVDNSPDKIIRYDREFRRVYINSPEQWDAQGKYVVPLKLGETLLESSTSEDPAAYVEKLKAVFATGREQEIEIHERRQGSGVLTAHVRLVPEFGLDGTVETVLAVGRDITALTESRQLLARLADAAPGAIYTVLLRPDGTMAVPYASPHFEDIYGLRPDEVEEDAAPARARINPDDVSGVVAAYERSAEALTPLHLEFRVRHPEKGERWVEARSTPVRRDDGAVLWHGFMHDVTARKHAEQELYRREEEFRALVEHSTDLITRYDRDCRRTYVNPAWSGINRLAPDAVLGSSPEEGSPLVDAKPYVAKLKEALATGKAVECETEAVRKTGEIASYHNVITPEFGPDGTVESVLVVARDVTALKASQRLLTRLSENTPGVLHTFLRRPDGSGAIPYASPHLEDIYGVRPEEVTDDNTAARKRVHPDDARRLVAAADESARTLSPLHVDYRVYHPVKGELWVEARSMPERQPDGGILWYGFLHDITERKRMDARLAESEHEFHTLAENFADAFVRYDSAARIVYANPVFLTLLGRRLEDVRGKTPVGLGLPEAELFEGWVREVIRTGAGKEIEHHVENVREENFWGMVRLSPEFDEKGGVKYVQVVTRDITERKEAELELHRREQEIRALIENSPDSIVRYDRDCRRVYVNPAWEARRAPAVPLTLGKTTLEQSPLLDPQAYFDKIKAVLATGTEQELEIESRTKFGEIVISHVRMAPEFGPDGAVAGVLAVGRDISEMKKNQSMIAHLAEAVPGVMFTLALDADGWISLPYASPSLADVCGIRPDDVKDSARPLLSLLYPVDRDRVSQAIRQSARDLTFIHDEYLINHPQKGQVWLETQAAPERQADGGTVWYGFLHDITARKHAEAALLGREDEIRTLVENTPGIIVRYDANGHRTFVNRAWTEVFGQSQDEMVGKTPLDGSPLVDPQAYLAHIQYVRTSGEPRDFQAMARNKFGQLREYTCRAAPEFDATGKVRSVLMVAHDITALKETQRKLEHWAEVSPGVMYSFHMRKDGSIAIPYASPNFQEIYGLSPADVAEDATAARNRVHPDDLERIVSAMEKSSRDLTPFELEYRVVHPAKGELWVEARMSAERHPDGGTLWHGFLHDVTIRKKADLALQLDHDLFVQGPVVVAKRRNARGWPFEYISSNAKAVVGVSAEDILSGAVTYPDIVPPEFCERLEAEASAALKANKDHFSFRPYPINPPDGKTRWLYEFDSVVRNASGEVTHLLSYFIDVTESKRFEEESRAKSEFLAHMSHELRTPLNSILGYTEMMGMDSFPLTLDGARKYAENINFAGRLLLRHIEDILTYAEINAGKRIVAQEPVDLRKALAEVTRMLHPQMRERRLTMLTSGDRQGLPPVSADSRSILQILTNVLGNAIKFSPDHGRIRVELKEAGEWLVLTIGDEGPGVPPDKLEAISQPFARSSDPTLARAPGTGLGLSIVVALVDMMGARVRFRNSPEGGLEVLLTLPIYLD